VTPYRLPLVGPLAPFDAAYAFAEAPFGMVLHGAGQGETSRWSYVMAEPVSTAIWTDGRGAVLGALDPPDPLGAIKAALGRLEFSRTGALPPFAGGLAGLFSYELAGTLVPKLEASPKGRVWPDLALGLYDTLAVFDAETGHAEVISWGWNAEGKADPDLARERAHAFAARLTNARPPRSDDRVLGTGARPDISQAQYENKVETVRALIAAGDCFQANISQGFSAELIAGVSAYDVFGGLLSQSQAGFSAYMRLEGLAVVSNSPERFVTVRPGTEGQERGFDVETRPIKGTRPRGRSPDEDARLASELLASVKDRAENLMIVDLMRNDLSRVCRAGSVKVPQLFRLESFANVHHLVSTVTGQLKPGLSGIDVLGATYPGGSITGAPKIRAMQIIAEIEEAPRGPYCGSILWLSPDGAMDASILIRTLACEQDDAGWKARFRSGGGIVIGSDPADEYQETLHKAARLGAVLGGLLPFQEGPNP
jgi:para-aminobenzoate synthetase component I